MAKLKVSKTRRANQKAALALYNIMETHSKKLGKELKVLERRNKDYQKSILIRTLAIYGAEDDFEVWDEQGQSGATKINNMLNERWKAVQGRLLIVEQQRKVIHWGQNQYPATSIVTQRAEKEKRRVDAKNVTLIPRKTPYIESTVAVANERVGPSTQDFNVGFEVNAIMLKKLLGSKSEILESKKKRTAHASSNPVPSDGKPSGDDMKASTLKTTSLLNDKKHDLDMMLHIGDVKISDRAGSINEKQSIMDDHVMDIDEDSEDEGLPLELLENPSLLLVQARDIKRQHFDKLAKPIRFGFVLERGDDCPFWGMYFSMLDFLLLSC